MQAGQRGASVSLSVPVCSLTLGCVCACACVVYYEKPLARPGVSRKSPVYSVCVLQSQRRCSLSGCASALIEQPSVKLACCIQAAFVCAAFTARPAVCCSVEASRESKSDAVQNIAYVFLETIRYFQQEYKPITFVEIAFAQLDFPASNQHSEFLDAPYRNQEAFNQ